jgi:hypothetical protein
MRRNAALTHLAQVNLISTFIEMQTPNRFQTVFSAVLIVLRPSLSFVISLSSRDCLKQHIARLTSLHAAIGLLRLRKQNFC